MGILSLLLMGLFTAMVTCRVIDDMDVPLKADEKPCLSCDRCGNGLVYYGNHCYLFSEDKLTWFEAMSVCANVVVSENGRAGWLSHIYDKAEDEFLKSEIQKRGNNIYWVGGTDIMKHGQFVWYQWRNFGCQDKQWWDKGEPNNAKENEHCTELLANGKLNDKDCHEKRLFICERRL